MSQAESRSEPAGATRHDDRHVRFRPGPVGRIHRMPVNLGMEGRLMWFRYFMWLILDVASWLF